MSAFDTFAGKALAPWISRGLGEAVVYQPRTGAPRPIQATVIRNPPASNNLSGQDVAPRMTVLVSNDAATGISSTELDTGGDKILVAYRKGTTAQAYAISWNPDDGQVGGMLNLKLR